MIHFHSDKDDGGSDARAKRQAVDAEADAKPAGAKPKPAVKPAAKPDGAGQLEIGTIAPSQEPKTYEKYLQRQGIKPAAEEDYSKDQRSGFMGYYREIDYDEKVCACANP
jgi:hypothetical protein